MLKNENNFIKIYSVGRCKLYTEHSILYNKLIYKEFTFSSSTVAYVCLEKVREKI